MYKYSGVDLYIGQVGCSLGRQILRCDKFWGVTNLREHQILGSIKFRGAISFGERKIRERQILRSEKFGERHILGSENFGKH